VAVAGEDDIARLQLSCRFDAAAVKGLLSISFKTN
jgi:hypothetical protein